MRILSLEDYIDLLQTSQSLQICRYRIVPDGIMVFMDRYAYSKSPKFRCLIPSQRLEEIIPDYLSQLEHPETFDSKE